MQKLFVALALVCLAAGATAQTLTQTSLVLPIDADDNQLNVAAVGTIAIGTELYIDREAMRVYAINGFTLSVQRGVDGTLATPHAGTTTLYYGPGSQFIQANLSGACFEGASRTWVNVTNAALFACQNGVWVQTNATSGSGLTDGDKGDVTVSGGGTVMAVDPLPESRITNLVTDLAAKVGVTDAQALTNKDLTSSTNSVGPAAIKDTCSDAGSTDAYACSLSPAIASYVTGAHYRFKANTANTGAATVNLNSLGAKTIKKAVGGVTTDLADNDIRVGQWVDIVYDGTNMQIQSVLGNAASGGSYTAGPGLNLSGGNEFSVEGGVYASHTSVIEDAQHSCTSAGTSTAYTCSPAQCPTGSFATGFYLNWIPDENGAGGATTMNACSTSTKKVFKSDGTTNPSSTDIVAGVNLRLQWDATLDSAAGGWRMPASGSVASPTRDWLLSFHPSASPSGVAVVGSANQVRVNRFYLAESMSITKCAFNVTVLAASSHTSIGIYSTAGNLLVDCGIADSSTTGQKTQTISSVALPGGASYYFAQASDSTTVQAFGIPFGSNYPFTMNAGSSPAVGTAANAYNAGGSGLPSTLGTITGAVSLSILGMGFFTN